MIECDWNADEQKRIIDHPLAIMIDWWINKQIGVALNYVFSHM